MSEKTKNHSEKSKKKKVGALDVYVIFSIACIILYTVAEHVLVILTGQTLDLLTSLFFAFFGGEVTICALVKKLKLKQTKKNNEQEEIENVTVG